MLEKLRGWIVEKLNPAQESIAMEEGSSVATTTKMEYRTAFDDYEVINRGINMIVSACSSLDYDVKEKTHDGSVTGIKAKQLHTLLNFRPNPYQSVQDFRTNIFTDFILEGNVFIYFDGAFFYHLPAGMVEIIPDPKTYINHYLYDSVHKFYPNEIAHFKDLSGSSIYRGDSRLRATKTNLERMESMLNFQQSFFDNGAVFNLAIISDNTLSQQAKEKTLANWMKTYGTRSGGKRPVILDSGMRPVPLGGANSFRELDFDTSIKTHNVKLLETLGVPPVLLDGGNQANISPNLRLFYLETVLPIVRKYVSAMEKLTGFNVDYVTNNISALQPELKDLSSYLSTMVNTGILTPNEAREEIRYDSITDGESDKLRVPANIAGSAVNPSQGGKPKNPDIGKD